MKKDRFIIVDPFNESHINLIKKDSRNNYKIASILEFLTDLKNDDSRQKEKEVKNEVKEVALLANDDEIKSIFLMDSFKDIKNCYITPIYCKSIQKERNLLNKVLIYLIAEMKMDQIFISIDLSENKRGDYLIEAGFECLGEVENSNKIAYEIDSTTILEDYIIEAEKPKK